MKCQQIATELASGFVCSAETKVRSSKPSPSNVEKCAVRPRRFSTRRSWLVSTPSTIGYLARRTNGSASSHWRWTSARGVPSESDSDTRLFSA